MKKIFLITALAFVLGSMFTACKKDEEKSAPMTGLWVGLEGLGQEVPSSSIAMLFRDNGTVRFFPDADTSLGTKKEGTYTLTGQNLEFQQNSSTYRGSGTVNSEFTIIEGGDWSFEDISGTFNLVKR